MDDLSQTFFCIPDASLLIILTILKPHVMATKGYSFPDDEKNIIDIVIDMDIVVEKEKNLKFQNWLNVFVCEK